LAILSNPKDPRKVLKLKELAHWAKETDIHECKSFGEEKFLTVAEAPPLLEQQSAAHHHHHHDNKNLESSTRLIKQKAFLDLQQMITRNLR
jgi:hypothetical protein